MPEYLKQLIKAEEWQKALAYAEQVASRGGRTLEEMAVVYRSILRARIALGEYSGAVAAGEIAYKLAADVADWDSYGSVCNDLGVSHLLLKQYDQASFYFHQYLANVGRFEQALEHRTLVWYNLGLLQKVLGNSPEAIAALTNAVTYAQGAGETEQVHSITLTLIDVLLKAGKYETVPRLLAESACYLRRQPPHTVQVQTLYQRLYRAEYALRTGRLRRARLLAIGGLLASEDRPRCQFDFHMLLSRVERSAGAPAEALAHALSARAYAIMCQRPDLEAAAANTMEALLAHRTEAHT